MAKTPIIIFTTLLVTLSTAALATHQYAYAPVITFNLANYDDHPHWEKRLQLLADEVQNNHANIIVLQEVRFNPDEPSTKKSYQNMAEQLLNTLHDRHDFVDARIVTQPAMYYSTHSWEGLSIISRYKIKETGSYFLTKADDCHDDNLRSVQYARLDVNGNDYFIANAHFGLNDACIKSNIEESISYLKRIAGDGRLLFLGDFNTTPDNQSLKLLKQAGLADLWEKFHPGETGYTFPSAMPSKRIDYAFANAPVAERIYGKDYVRIIGNSKKDGVYPSDHLGMVVEFLAWE